VSTPIPPRVREALEQARAAKLARTAPDEAFSDLLTHEVNNDWLGSMQATNDQIANAMRRWFLERYCDPAMETPYSSDMGGYFYVNGGPYDAHDQLFSRFEGLVDEGLIEAVADELVSDQGPDWAPTQLTYYRPDEDVFVDDRNEPTVRLEGRLGDINAVLGLGGDAFAEVTARNLVFASVISSLETFLWETLVYWVDHDEDVVRRLITDHPHFRNEDVKLHTILDISDPIGFARTKIRSHMQTTVWHRWDKVASLYQFAFKIRIPSVEGFTEAIKIRHDIVHRSGQTVDGVEHAVTVDAISTLSAQVLAFANEMDRKIADATAPTAEEEEPSAEEEF
jgi:hypothetical protein